jgi:hypothetical protein
VSRRTCICSFQHPYERKPIIRSKSSPDCRTDSVLLRLRQFRLLQNDFGAAEETPAKMAHVTILVVPFGLAAALGALRTLYFFRARAMRRFASRWGLQYIGPAAPPQWWFNTSRPIIPSPLPGWISRLGISQAWNIIEGKNNGTSLFVFDGLSEGFRSQPRTCIAYHTEQSPFGMSTPAEPVTQMRGWTVLLGVWFLGFSWLMGIGRLDRHLSNLRED